jgi:hypothetical protein
MKPFDLEDIESVAYVDKDINYVMFCVGFDFEPVDSMPSKKIH